jgi:Uma2 family endonuclease
MAIATPLVRDDQYPTSDGKPMAETDRHADIMTYLKEGLRGFFSANPNVYVSGNNFIYWVQGDPAQVVSPDVYVVFGVPMMQRDCYMAWKEGGLLPDVVFEITSKKTRREDSQKKLPLYEKVFEAAEYYQFDPFGEYLRPRLQGFHLVDGTYVRQPVSNGRLRSPRLGLDLVEQDDWLGLFDPVRGEFIPSYADQMAEISRLKAENEALRKR